jgi:hypothetical protein
MNKLKYIVIATGFISNSIIAQTGSINVVTTAVPFLRITPDAAAGGMGSTGIATIPGANAAYWNVGKLPFTTTKGAINSNYSPWLREWSNDTYLASVTGFYKLNDNEVIHGLVRYFNPGNLVFTDKNGSKLQTYHPNEFGIDAGYSRKLSERVGLGLTLKYIRSDLSKGTQNGESFKAGNAIAADLGFYYDLRKEDKSGWSFGATLANLGSKISYVENSNQKDFIPANLGLGASYSSVINDQNRINIALDINKLLVPTPPSLSDSVAITTYRSKSVVGSWFSSFGDAPGGFKEELKEVQLSMGIEYWYDNKFALRVGYFYEDKLKGNRQHVSAGVSVKYNVATINFCYLTPTGKSVNRDPLSNTLQFGLLFEFEN